MVDITEMDNSVVFFMEAALKKAYIKLLFCRKDQSIKIRSNAVPMIDAVRII